MTQFDNSHYIEKDSIKISSGTLASWQSTQLIDDQWDAFLASSPYAHFYQSSLWGEVRKLDGWQPLIMVITLDGHIAGGFLMLWRKKSYIGKIGIVLKGPLLESDIPELRSFTLETIRKTSRENKIRALIIQPPDKCPDMTTWLESSGFCRNHLDFIVMPNTVSVDLQGTEDEIFKRIKRIKRQNINTAIRKGIVVRQGGRDDIRTFFEFMIETCKRQKVTPSPSSIDFLYKLWDLFCEKNHVNLFIAEFDGEIITCLLVLPFGQTAYLWKFGWSGNLAKYHPNMLIYWESFRWAKSHGYLFADLATIETALAETLLCGNPISEQMSKTYSYFKVGFGGEVVPLSKGFVYLPNPVIRLGYNLLMPIINSRPSLKKKFLFNE